MRPSRSSSAARSVAAAAALSGLVLVGRDASAADPAPADAAGDAPPAAAMFGKKCGSCHTLGEGDRAGPDLLGVTKRRDRKWIGAFIRTPGAVIDGGDAVANELVSKFKGVRMPDQTLTDEELEGLLKYLDDCTVKGGCKLSFGKAKAAREATPAEIAEGRAIFEGRAPLANGGAACISCHSVRGVGPAGGGTLARDLTHVYARLGEQGTTAALASTPFPLMKNLYADHPLRDAEAFKLKAFLYDASRDGSPPPRDHSFFYVGTLGALAAFTAIGAAWAKRLEGVRRRIARRGYR
jgi:mono/diheme cytochrome c family protein